MPTMQRRDSMRQIDEKIKWLEQNATRKDDDLIKAKLKMINHLYDEIKNSEDAIFMDEIIKTFLEIMDVQRGVIFDLKMEMESGTGYTPGQHSFVAAYAMPQDGFQTDKQLQTAFTAYLTSKGRSSYTINDYCSRIRILWKTFYEDLQKGNTPITSIPEDAIKKDQPLVNAFLFSEVLILYIKDHLACAANKRNLANTQAAMSRLNDFKHSLI